MQLRVLDLEAAVKHYTQVLGLWETARDKQGRVFLKAWDEHDHHSDDEQEMDEATKSVGRHHTQQPEHDQQKHDEQHGDPPIAADQHNVCQCRSFTLCTSDELQMG